MADDRPVGQSAIVDRYVAEAFARECDDVVFLVRRVQAVMRNMSARWRAGRADAHARQLPGRRGPSSR